MFIVWKGWGILVIPMLAVAFMLAGWLSPLVAQLGIDAIWAHRLTILLMFTASGVGIWFMAKGLMGPVRRMIDKDTGREFVIQSGAGSLFFIPTRYWAFIAVAIGLVLCALTTPSDVFPSKSDLPQISD